MKLSLAVVFFGLAFNLQALAAGAESHGGQAVFCPGKQPVMLDYYQATLPTMDGGAPELVDISKMSSDGVVALAMGRLGYSLGSSVTRAFVIIGEVGNWLEGNLQSVPDSEPAYTLPADCELRQVAVRQDNTMYVDPAIFNQLSLAQQGILRIHEALYYVSQKNGFNSSVQVRSVIRNLLMKKLDVVELSISVHEMGSKFFWWEQLDGKTFYGDGDKKSTSISFKYDPMVGGLKMSSVVTLVSPPGDVASPIVMAEVIQCGNGDVVYDQTCSTLDPNPGMCTVSKFDQYVADNYGELTFQMDCKFPGTDKLLHLFMDEATQP